MAAVELVGDRSTKAPTDPALNTGQRVQEECIKRGLYTRIRGDIIMLCPPLVIRDEEVDRIVDILREALQAVVPERA
jgi:adenosylmethionine-8-amino-7-oxononanoate aminotransferase